MPDSNSSRGYGIGCDSTFLFPLTALEGAGL